MRQQKAPKSESVRIRIETKDKEKIIEIARSECRSFACQCKLALKEWLQRK